MYFRRGLFGEGFAVVDPRPDLRRLGRGRAAKWYVSSRCWEKRHSNHSVAQRLVPDDVLDPGDVLGGPVEQPTSR